MKKFNLAILSPSDKTTVSAVLTVWAEDIKAALKRVRQDPDMQDAHIYPVAE
jgi:hypothetical protein